MGNTTQMTSVMSSYSQLASDDLEPASPYPQASLASATAQLHDEPVEPSQRPASHSVQDLVNSAANQMTVYKEVCQCANDPELVQAVRLRLERTQADLQSLVTVEEEEEALMRLLTRASRRLTCIHLLKLKRPFKPLRRRRQRCR